MNHKYLPNLIFWAVIAVTVIILQVVRLLVADLAVYNSGIAFGISLPSGVILVVSSMFLVALLVWFIVRPQKTALWTAALALIVGGGISNLFERIFLQGQVADYIKLGNISDFNLADVAIVVGIAVVLYEMIKYESS